MKNIFLAILLLASANLMASETTPLQSVEVFSLLRNNHNIYVSSTCNASSSTVLEFAKGLLEEFSYMTHQDFPQQSFTCKLKHPKAVTYCRSILPARLSARRRAYTILDQTPKLCEFNDNDTVRRSL